VGTRWTPPAKLTEPAGAQLAAFGIRTIPGARVNFVDPPVSEKQRRFFGAELGRKRAGKATRTGLSEAQLRDFARTPR
jgi:hypothetical protein